MGKWGIIIFSVYLLFGVYFINAYGLGKLNNLLDPSVPPIFYVDSGTTGFELFMVIFRVVKIKDRMNMNSKKWFHSLVTQSILRTLKTASRLN